MDNKKKKDIKRKPPSIWRMISTVLALFLIVSLVYTIITGSKTKSDDQEVSISQLVRDINENKIVKIDVAGEKVTATYSDKTIKTTKKEADASLTDTLNNYGVTPENLAKTEINFKNNSGAMYIIGNILQIFGPFLIILLFFWFLTRQMKGGGGMQALSFGQSKARLTDPENEKDKVTFKDVAGCKEAKEELGEIVDFLKNPKKFLDIGARIPKGVLLTGAPGTGKTLLARAVAGEAGVPFFHISGSEFVELFVGIGASRVRDLFAVAKKAAPSIIFVDEIDAVGRIRGSGIGGGNDEREQTLNQILVEMDGFEPAEKVIVMAATNRNDVLDPALLRPGRFDRRVILDLPDRNDREEILKIHLKGKPQESDVLARLIAERTSGFSGADLFSLVNESAILAARENRKTVSQIDLIRSIEKVLLGPERKSHLFSTHEKEITAYHEAGHAILASVLPDADPVHKVTIIPRGNAGGYTMHIPLEDRKLRSKREFIDDITMSLGGYVAEKMIFGDVTTGPSSDLQVSTAMARAMVTRFGMSDLGVLALEEEKNIYEHKPQYSDKIAGQVDDEVLKIMAQAKVKAEDLLTKHRDALDAVAKKLIEVETLEQEEYNKVIIACGITPKVKTVEA